VETVRTGYTAEQIRAAEAPHLAAREPLMQVAAEGLADELLALLQARMRRSQDPEAGGEASFASQSVLILVGSGNNGGDALFAGARLAAKGVQVSILGVGSRMHEAGLLAAVQAGARVEPASADEHHDGGNAGGASGAGGAASFDLEWVAGLASKADIVVDAILGTGSGSESGSMSAALRGLARDIVRTIKPIVEASDGPLVVAVDLPSGIDPTDGTVPDPVVLSADVTVTFGGVKSGLLLPPASLLAGRIVLIDIGLGPELEKMEPAVRISGASRD
jgi:NAD(P)H-hydrate epimerase